MTKKQIIERSQFRSIRLDSGRIDKTTRTVSAALSSETPVRQLFGNEILSHEEGSINMERAVDGLPLLFAHDRERPIGRVDNIRLDPNRVLRGDATFSNNDDASQVWGDVSEGFLRDLSLGYRIDEYEEQDEDTFRVTRFTPLEVSVVTVPADNTVGINRSHEESKMSDEDKTSDVGTEKPEPRQEERDVKRNIHQFRIDREKERQRGAKQEAQRREDIRSLFSRYEDKYGDDFSALRDACERDAEVTVELAKQAILEAVADGYVSIDVSTRQDMDSRTPDIQKSRPRGGVTRMQMGEDQIDKFCGAAEIAISVQANGVYTPEEQKESQRHEYYSMSVTELAREYLRVTGRRGSGQKHDIIGEALKRDISHSSSHFASVLENVANKSMLDGFTQAPETWARWVQTRNIPDFKAASLLNMSLFGDLDMIREGGQYEYGDMSDIKETIQLATYGKLFGISRQALAGDDLNALGDIPRGMGAAAAYKIGDVVYAVLTSNGTMLQDSTNLFHADHSNLVTSGAAPSVATLNAGRTAMALQTDPNSKVLGIRAAHILVPIALQTTAEVLIAAQYDPAAVAGTLTPNPFQNTLGVVADHRLDAANAAGWYLAAARNTVVVGFLNGQQSPYLESKDGWSIDGVEYKVRIDAAAAAADYRGLYYNDGVT